MRRAGCSFTVTVAASLLLTLPAFSVEGNYSMEMLQVETRGRVIRQLRQVTGTMRIDASGALQYNGAPGAIMPDGYGRYRLSHPSGQADASLRAFTSDAGEVLIGSSAGVHGVDNLFLAVRQPSGYLAVPPEAEFHGGIFRMVPAVYAVGESRFLTMSAGVNAIVLGNDGRGTATVPGIGEFRVALSAGGKYLIGAPVSGPGGILFAVRKTATPPQGLHFSVALAAYRDALWSGSGSLLVGSNGEVRLSQAEHSPVGATDLRGVGLLSGWTEGRALLAGQPTGGGAGSGMVVAAENDGVAWLMAAIPAPSPEDSGAVFLHPYGIVDAASSAPTGNPLAPNGLVSAYGLRLATETRHAETIPLPQELAGVRVEVNGEKAGLLLVSPGQINFHLPPGVAVGDARIQVVQPQGASAAVRVPVAASSPGIFAVSQGGTGPAVVTHADFQLVTPSYPARGGEVVVIFLTGLGNDQPPPLVYVGGEVAEVQYAGAHSIFVGLYQVNVKLPVILTADPAAVMTLKSREGWSDMVTLAVTP